MGFIVGVFLVDLLINIYSNNDSQPEFACSKLAIATLGQGVKYVQSKQSRHQSDVIDHIPHLVLVFLLLNLNM